MKVFLSHRMSGLTESEVMKIREDATKLLTEKYGEIEIIDNYHHIGAPENAGRVWHLGTSISQMDEADAIYFCDGNTYANGCLIEMMVASLYHLRVLNVEIGLTDMNINQKLVIDINGNLNNLISIDEYNKDYSKHVGQLFEYNNHYSKPVYICKKCGGGMCRNEMVVCTSLPPKYEYRCNSCSNIEYNEY